MKFHIRLIGMSLISFGILCTTLSSTALAATQVKSHSQSASKVTIASSRQFAKSKLPKKYASYATNLKGTITVETYSNGQISVSGTTASQSSSGTLQTFSPNSIPNPGVSDYTSRVWGYEPYQGLRGWIGPRAVDSRGPHYNMHVQDTTSSSSGKYADLSNFHVRYEGNNQWSVYDSQKGTTSYYPENPSDNGATAADQASSEMAANVQAQYGNNFDEELQIAQGNVEGEDPMTLPDVFLDLW